MTTKPTTTPRANGDFSHLDNYWRDRGDQLRQNGIVVDPLGARSDGTNVERVEERRDANAGSLDSVFRS